jgi:hypothetical protein
MGRIHLYDACISPCDDPESQMVVPIGSEGSGKFSRGSMTEQSSFSLMRASLHPKLQTRCSGETVRIIRLET